MLKNVVSRSNALGGARIDEAGLFSFVTYSWIFSYLWSAFRGRLDRQQVWMCSIYDASNVNMARSNNFIVSENRLYFEIPFSFELWSNQDRNAILWRYFLPKKHQLGSRSGCPKSATFLPISNLGVFEVQNLLFQMLLQSQQCFKSSKFNNIFIAFFQTGGSMGARDEAEAGRSFPTPDSLSIHQNASVCRMRSVPLLPDFRVHRPHLLHSRFGFLFHSNF